MASPETLFSYVDLIEEQRGCPSPWQRLVQAVAPAPEAEGEEPGEQRESFLNEEQQKLLRDKLTDSAPLFGEVRYGHMEMPILDGESAGATPLDLFLIAEGACAILFPVAPEGEDAEDDPFGLMTSYQLVNRCYPPDVVGEVSAILGSPRSAHVRAEGDSIWLLLTPENLESLREEHGLVYTGLMAWICENIARKLDRMGSPSWMLPMLAAADKAESCARALDASRLDAAVIDALPDEVFELLELDANSPLGPPAMDPEERCWILKSGKVEVRDWTDMPVASVEAEDEDEHRSLIGEWWLFAAGVRTAEALRAASESQVSELRAKRLFAAYATHPAEVTAFVDAITRALATKLVAVTSAAARELQQG
jgi:CRP-like cAMP-binding protein